MTSLRDYDEPTETELKQSRHKNEIWPESCMKLHWMSFQSSRKTKLQACCQQKMVRAVTDEVEDGEVPNTCNIEYFTFEKVSCKEVATTNNINYKIWKICNFL